MRRRRFIAVGPVVILLTLATASLLPQRYDTLAVRDGVRDSLFKATVRRSPGFHLPGDLSTDDADLAEKPVACSVQPVKVLFGGHGFGAIQPNYRREGNLNPAVVTSQPLNLANYGSLSHRHSGYVSGGAVAETGPEKGRTLVQVQGRSFPQTSLLVPWL